MGGRARLTRRPVGGPSDAPHAALVTALKAGTPATMVVLSDSTGNDWGEWPRVFSAWLASKVPAVTVTYRLWNNTNQAYGPMNTLQLGAAGDRYATLGAASTQFCSTPTNVAYNVTDLDVRVCLTAVYSSAPAALGTMVARAGGTDPNRSWWFYLNTNGTLGLAWCPTGSNASNIVVASTANVNTVFADGTRAHLRATLDVDDGAGHYLAKFWTSVNNGASWQQLGTTITGGTATSLPPSVSTYVDLGCRSHAAVTGLDANYHSMELLNAIDGSVVACADLDRAVTTANTFLDASGRTWTFNATPTLGGSTGLLVLNGSIAGTTIATIRAQLTAMTPALGALLFFVNLGHNGGANGGNTDTYQSLITETLTRYPSAEPFVLVQNPEKTAAAGYAVHATYMDQVRVMAQAAGYRYADAYVAFLADADYEANLMYDDIHPNAAGSQLQSDTVRRRICRP